MKNKAQLDGMPVWFDGKSINEALFCEEFLQTHKIIFTNGAFFTPEGRVTDELPLCGEIFEELKCCAVSNIPRKISNIVELMKLAALVEDFPPLFQFGGNEQIRQILHIVQHLAGFHKPVIQSICRCLGCVLHLPAFQKMQIIAQHPQAARFLLPVCFQQGTLRFW